MQLDGWWQGYKPVLPHNRANYERLRRTLLRVALGGFGSCAVLGAFIIFLGLPESLGLIVVVGVFATVGAMFVIGARQIICYWRDLRERSSLSH